MNQIKWNQIKSNQMKNRLNKSRWWERPQQTYAHIDICTCVQLHRRIFFNKANKSYIKRLMIHRTCVCAWNSMVKKSNDFLPAAFVWNELLLELKIQIFISTSVNIDADLSAGLAHPFKATVILGLMKTPSHQCTCYQRTNMCRNAKMRSSLFTVRACVLVRD